MGGSSGDGADACARDGGATGGAAGRSAGAGQCRAEQRRADGKSQAHPPDNRDSRTVPKQPQNTPGQSARGIPFNSAPPRSEEESSSDQTRIDLSPPKGDELAHPEGGDREGHEWNPLRAMKDVEVGDFYYKEGNYKAALSRYREALRFKPRDAVATSSWLRLWRRARTLRKRGLSTRLICRFCRTGRARARQKRHWNGLRSNDREAFDGCMAGPLAGSRLKMRPRAWGMRSGARRRRGDGTALRFWSIWGAATAGRRRD